MWERAEDFNNDDNRLLQKKYSDVALIRLANTCHSFCRFCFEKERTLRHGVATDAGPEQFAVAVEKIKSDSKIRTVLISGGDPFIVPDEILGERLRALAAIPHLKTIRINTRALLHNPFRVTPELAKMLGTIQKESWTNCEKGIQIRIGVHFNNPRELTLETIQAIRTLQCAGVELYNQTVLLKGINDTFETVYQLFRLLREEGVELHYFSHAMTVPRTSHFRTSVRKGQEIMQALKQCKEFRGQLPRYELSHHTGKHMIPDTMNESFYEDVIEKNGIKIPIIKFVSDVTHQWEVWPDGRD